MNPVDQQAAPHEITKEAVALMRRAASITGNEEIKFAASHIQSEYDRKQHLNTVAKEQLKVEETQKGKAIRANMEQRKRLFSMRGLRQNRQVSNSNQDNIQMHQVEGLMRSFQQSRQPTGPPSKGGQDQQQTGIRQRRFNPRIRRVDSQGNQINKEPKDKEEASSSSGTLSDVSSNGIGERTPPMISMVHVPSLEQKEQRPRHQVHPLQRTKSASTSDLNKGKNQKKPFARQQHDDDISFAKLTLEEAHILQSIADKTGNRQLKAISSRVQKVINENTPQPLNITKETIETKEEAIKESGVAQKPKEEEEESVGFLSLINLIPIEIPQSSICELCETCNKEGSELQTTSADKIEGKLPPPIDQEFLSGTSTY